jgi:ABC-2 type transport system permease protein
MLLVSPSTYIAATSFLFFMGFIFTGILESYAKAAQDISPASVFFSSFFLPVFFMVPLLTMKCLAEERRLGTIETLLTTPVTTAEVVLGKYAAAYSLYIALWGATGGFFYILQKFSTDPRFLDRGPLLGGYLFIAVSGLLFIAIGVFASSLSRNQAVAAGSAKPRFSIARCWPRPRRPSTTPRSSPTTMTSPAAWLTPGSCFST